MLFGFIMLVSIIRFALRGWIEQLYLEPTFFFTYPGFDWVKPLGQNGMYFLFGCMAIASIGIMLGWKYRLSATVFFLTFTYVELIDKTNYLNHYYFVSIVSFLLMLLPAACYFSVDSFLDPGKKRIHVPAWTIGSIKLQLGMVYFFAGIAKINTDWLLRAMPLKIWLAGKSNVPLIGWLFNYSWTAFVFSWFGMLYDILVPFALVIKKTRPYAYAAVIGFHVMTAMLFNIGMFPYIMILSTLVFFPAKYHEAAILFFQKSLDKLISSPPRSASQSTAAANPSIIILSLLALHFTIQAILPLRHIAYPGNLFWTEEGYRFSWRVMLMEKAGYAEFTVQDSASKRQERVRNDDYLTPYQEKMMSTQPDMIVQYANHLAGVYQAKGYRDPIVTVDSYVTLNGRRSQHLINPLANLTEQTPRHYSEIITEISSDD